MQRPGQINQKNQNIFCSKRSLNSRQNIRISSALQGFILETHLIVLGSLKRPYSYFLCAE